MKIKLKSLKKLVACYRSWAMGIGIMVEILLLDGQVEAALALISHLYRMGKKPEIFEWKEVATLDVYLRRQAANVGNYGLLGQPNIDAASLHCHTRKGLKALKRRRDSAGSSRKENVLIVRPSSCGLASPITRMRL